VARKLGKVVFFNKGYGFISTEESDFKSDIFVHFSQIVMEGYKKLEPGQTVSFEVGMNHKGPMAVNVRLEEDE
jgi:CspA family cold shock protein